MLNPDASQAQASATATSPSRTRQYFRDRNRNHKWVIIILIYTGYIDLDEQVEVVLTNRKDNQVGVRIRLCARVMAARNRKPSGG